MTPAEVPDELVEKAARALRAEQCTGHDHGTDACPDRHCRDDQTLPFYRARVRPVLAAVPTVTPAVERAARVYMAKQIGRPAAAADYHPSSLDIDDTGDILAAGLVVEEMAPFIDPTIVEPLRSKVMSAWRSVGLDAEKYMADSEAKAFERATELRTALLGRAA